MIYGVDSCSWCHYLTRFGESICRLCGHQGRLPQSLCYCPACAPTKTQAEQAARTPQILQALVVRMAAFGPLGAGEEWHDGLHELMPGYH